MTSRRYLAGQRFYHLTKSTITPSYPPPPLILRRFSDIPPSQSQSLSNIFQRYGFSRTHLPDFFKKNPFLLHLCPDDVSSRINTLKVFGFSEPTIARVLQSMPSVILLNQAEIRSKVEFLIGIGFNSIEIDWIFSSFPLILAFGVENRLQPLLNEFEELGLSLDEVRTQVLRNPVALGFENGEVSHCLEMLRALKCRKPIKDSIFRQGEFRAAHEAKLRVDCLRKYDLTYRDAFMVLLKEPRVMLYDIDDIVKKIDFLVGMKFGVECLVDVPEYLGVNFDKQIVPRFKVIEYLQSNGGLGDEIGVRMIVKLSRLQFYNMYVKPYPECEKIYGRFNRDVKVQSRHPVGMWKLFRPQKYPESCEDVENIKYYVESLPSSHRGK